VIWHPDVLQEITSQKVNNIKKLVRLPLHSPKNLWIDQQDDYFNDNDLCLENIDILAFYDFFLSTGDLLSQKN